jgi:hypothetical protein
MACSTEAQATRHRQIRRQLALDGVSDPFAIAAEALARSERLEAEVLRLTALLPPKHKKGAPRPLFPLRLTPVTSRAH